MTTVTDGNIHDANVGSAGASRQEYTTNEKMIGKRIPFQRISELAEWQDRYDGHIESELGQSYFVIDKPRAQMRA